MMIDGWFKYRFVPYNLIFFTFIVEKEKTVLVIINYVCFVKSIV